MTVIAATFITGCQNEGESPNDSNPTSEKQGEKSATDESSPTTGVSETDRHSTSSTPQEKSTDSPTKTPVCDQDTVRRPSPTPNGDVQPKQYPDPPSELSKESVATYLSAFETAYATNWAIENHDVTSVTVSGTDTFDVEKVDDGFLAHANIHIMLGIDDGQRTSHGDQKYVANYFVTPAFVTRLESNIEPEDPRENIRDALVSCSE